MAGAAPAADHPFLAPGGEMAARIRAHDWARTPVGAIDGWPPELRVALELCLASTFPTAIYWGPALTLFYNDAWAFIPAERHPAALGRPAREVWPDIWDVVGPQFEAVLATGEGIAQYDQLLGMERGGVRQETYWNYSLTAIRRADGTVAGIFNQGNETTRVVLGERRREQEAARLRGFFATTPSAVALLHGPDHVFTFANAAYQRLVGGRALVGRSVAEALPEVVGQGFLTLLDSVFQRGEPFVGSGVEIDLQDATGRIDRRLLDFAYQPMRDDAGAVTGILVQATDITERGRSEAALRRAAREREFILMLAERQRALPDPDDIMQLTAELVGEFLAVDRAGFCRLIEEREIEFGACWTNGVLPPLIGRLPVELFGAELAEASRAGASMVYRDVVQESGRVARVSQLSRARSGIAVPLLRAGRWEASFTVSYHAPRDWQPHEVALVEEAAQLCWDSVARATATARLRELNETLADEVKRRTAERDRLWQVSRDLLGIATPDGTWLSINPAWERLLGWKTHEILGRSSRWIIHPDDLPGLERALGQIAAHEEVGGYESRLLTVDGTYRTLSWVAHLDEGLIVASARDVTSEREQRAALVQAEERTRLVLEAISGVGVWTLDLATRLYFSEGNIAELYGLSPDEVSQGVPLDRVLERVHPDDVERLRISMEQGQSGSGDAETEFRLLLPDGSMRWIMARNHVVSGEHGRADTAIGVALDVTEQRTLEERLRQSQKMEAVGQLTGGLAHDFNNLLTGISGALEMLQLRLQQGRVEETARYVTTAQGAVTRAAGLTHRLLAFSRRQTLDPRPTDVNRLVEGMADLIRRTIGAIELRVDLAPDLWPALVDPGQLENALLNLCINARDAMPDGGIITIHTENRQFDAEAASIREVQPGDYLALRVSDTGTGMTEEVRARAFDPFFTTKALGEGTGLGLSMIYGFARQSGGTVRIDSVLGEGTSVTVKLPRHYGAADAPAPAPRGVDLDERRSGSVLVVDDEPAVRALVTDLLTEFGYTAVATVDARGALAILESDAVFDLLITDVGLPGGMNGRQLADAARALRPGLPTIFITGFAENSVFGERPLEPRTAIVTKPFTIQHLASKVRELLDGHVADPVPARS